MSRRAALRLLAGLLVVAGPLLAVLPGAAPAAAAPSRAVVIIDTGGSVRTEVVSFSGTITGLEALRLAGADPVTYGYAGQGAGVCALDGVGHTGTDECLGTADDPRYWSYWHASDGAGGWSYARECACTFVVHDGDVEGWKFGTGARPPFRSFCDVVGCAPEPAPTPEPGPGPGPAPVAAPGSSGPVAEASGGVASPGAVEPDPAAPSVTTTLPTATTAPVTPLRVRSVVDGRRADAGSPVGLLVALGAAVVVVVTTFLVRRRTR